MKKIYTTLLVALMVFAMNLTTFAAGNGSITINNAVVGETYTIYRLLDLESYNAETGAYSYKANNAWESWLREQTDYVVVDDQSYVTWVTDADPAAFAKAAKSYAEDNSIVNQGAETAETTKVEFTGLDLGYYLVDTTLGTLCSLDTTDPDVNISEKNEKPRIEKVVQEDSDDNWGETDDADFTQTVNFKTTITAKEGAEAYIVHDILSEGLALKEDSISIDGMTEGTDYEVKYNVACTGKDGASATCDFHIIFAQSTLDKLEDDEEIVITYSATLDQGAVVGLPGNPNDTRLQYSTDNWTEWDTTITYTWDMDVLKYGNADETNVLSGAKFVLLNSDRSKVATFSSGKFNGWADVPADNAAWPVGAELTTGENGKIEVDGLDSDSYHLRETQAPAGYNKLPNDVSVEITGAEGTTALTYDTVVKKINNQSGTVLPETGAAGTMMFITIGSLFALIAVVFMVTRKKMSVYES